MQSASQSSETIWRIRLFDGVQLEDSAGNKVHRFRSQRVGALLAYLALHLGRACSREELCEALWPDEDLGVTANRLRVALTSLRHQLEPAGTLFGTVLDVSELGRVRLRSETVWCDAVEFDVLWKAGKREQAIRLIRGNLLPGFFDEWILTARNRYALLLEEWEEGVSTSSPDNSPPEAAPPPPQFHAPLQRLPLYLTRFFGRETEQERLQELLYRHRLITLTGTGGIGKTRMAVETARRLVLPCIFVPLADLPDPERVPDAILQALLISPQANVDPVEQLIAVLQVRPPLLLILDNAEHLVAAVSALSLRLLEELPELRLLVTSRQHLEIPGEATLTMLPLEPPPRASAPERLAEFPAVALFLDRARAARPDFILSPRNADALVKICLRLEGMPLALELAAARVTAQTPAQIAADLTTGLIDLKSRQRGLQERHRSLRAAIQGSYDLLPANLRAFFGALAVFQGGWTREAARAVSGEEEAEAYLEELVIRSLVTAREEEEDGTIRYFFLETLRQFAAEQVSEVERNTLRERHAHYFLKLVTMVSEEDIRSYLPLDAEQENLVAALDWGREGSASLYWNALAGALTHAFQRGRHRIALNWAEEAMAAVSALPDADLRFHLRRASSLILVDVGRLDACLQDAEEAEAEAKASGNLIAEALSISEQGYIVFRQGNYENALRIQRKALQLARTLGDHYLLTRCLSLMTAVLTTFGATLGHETEAGNAMLREAEELGRELIPLLSSHSSLLSTAWSGLFASLGYQQRTEEAYLALKEAQRIAGAHRKLPVQMFTLMNECHHALILGHDEFAALRFGGFLEIQERLGYDLGTITGLAQEIQDQLRKRLGVEEFDLLLRRGRQTPFEAFAAEWIPTERLFSSYHERASVSEN